MTVSYTHEIPMGHRLKDHKGKCRFLHGHNYLVVTRVSGHVDEKSGMVIDFHDLKTAVRSVLSSYDHSFVLQHGDDVLKGVDATRQQIIYMKDPPTAENLAKLWQSAISNSLKELVLPETTFHVALEVRETRDCNVQTS